MTKLLSKPTEPRKPTLPSATIDKVQEIRIPRELYTINCDLEQSYYDSVDVIMDVTIRDPLAFSKFVQEALSNAEPDASNAKIIFNKMYGYIEYITEVVNPKYESEKKKYEKQLYVYLGKYEKYIKELKEWNEQAPLREQVVLAKQMKEIEMLEKQVLLKKKKLSKQMNSNG